LQQQGTHQRCCTSRSHMGLQQAVQKALLLLLLLLKLAVQ
jgi:hypothetical protein